MISSFIAPSVAIGLVLVLAWWCGRLARHIGQPAVIGELAAGIIVGPSVFGAVAPAWAALVFTPMTTAALGTIAQAAAIVYMFLVGIEIDTRLLRQHAGGVARIAAFSLLIPFGIGCGLAVWLYPSTHGPVMHRTAYILFLGTAMSITAMPVLTRILRDWRMLTSTIGTITVGCAAVDDIAAWTMLGLIVGLVRGETNVFAMLALCGAYLAVMLVLVRPALARLANGRSTGLGRAMWFAVVAVVALLSTFAADRIGIHAVFGAFFAGACMPRGHGALDSVERPLRQVSGVLLPAFFVLTGLRTQVGLMTGAAHWLITLSVIACAGIGKLGGSAFAARTLGFSWRESLGIGALLNTRGLVALVALDIGRDLGILSPTLFTVFVVMVFVTTLATVPLLRALGFRPLANASGRP